MFLLALLSAVGIGLLGSTHCLGMCGGINSLMLVAEPESEFKLDARQSRAKHYYIPLFNFGRICSYAIAGLALGSVSFAIQSLSSNVMAISKIVSGLLLLAMACYIGRWWLGLTRLESLTATLWKHLQPLVSHFIPVKSGLAAFKLGTLWGWMPCGMVYSTLSWAVLSQDPIRSSLLMFAFGLGTLPSMLAAGYFAQKLLALFKRPWVRNTSALLLMLFAGWTLYTGVQQFFSAQPMKHQHHHMTMITSELCARCN